MEQEIAAAIHPIDIGVIAAYFALVIGIGVWVSRMTETGDDLFLAGRSLTWGVIGVSLFASNISSTTLIGLTGSAYSSGIATSSYEWLAGLALIILAFVFAPLYLRARITTIPEFLELRFDRRVRVYFSIITIVLAIIIDTAGGLYAGAVVMRTFFPDLVIWQVCVGIGLFTGLYTATGGLKAVVYTDFLQAIILVLGTILLAGIMFAQLGFSLEPVRQATQDPNHLSMVQPMGDELLPWPGLLLGVPILGFWYWVTNQYIVQRVLGAKDIRHAQWGALLGGALKLIPLFTMVLPGAMAIAVLQQDLSNPDMVFPTLVTTVLPVGITGLVLAGLIAAIMSSVDSTLNASSTLVVHDFVLARKADASATTVRRYGQVTTLVLMTIAIIWAPMIASFGGLWAYLQQAFSVLVPPVVAIFLMGAFWKRGNAHGAFWTLAIGHVISTILFVLTQVGWWPLHFTINVGVMTAISAVIFVVASLQREAPSADVVRKATWSPELLSEEGMPRDPWYASLPFLASLLGLGMLAILIGFW